MPFANYPEHGADVINPRRRYKPAVLRALREFRRERPWRGPVAERKAKFRRLHRALCAAYGIRCRLRFYIPEPEENAGNGRYSPATNTISLIGRLSVVTYLHEFAHRIFGRCERKACEWSINLYRRIFRRSAARAIFEGHLVRINREQPTR